MDRVVEDLLECCERGSDAPVFGHGHGLTGLAIRWLGLTIEYGRHLRLGTAPVSVLGWKREVRVLEVWQPTLTTRTASAAGGQAGPYRGRAEATSRGPRSSPRWASGSRMTSAPGAPSVWHAMA